MPPKEQGLYRVAFTAEGSPLQEGKDTNSVVIYEGDEETEVNAELRKAFERRYRKLDQMEGSFAEMEISYKIKDKLGNVEESTHTVSRVEINNHRKDWYETLLNLKTATAGRRKKKLVIYPPSKDEGETLTRKYAETIFRDTDIKVIIYTKKVAQVTKTGNRKRNETRHEDTEAIVIKKKKKKTYKDILTAVKGKVKPDSDAAKCIRTIRESKRGDTAIVVEKKEKEAIEALKKEINKVEELDVRSGISEKKSMLFIRNMDGLATRQEVSTALKAELGDLGKKLTIGELRPYYGENQVVTISVTKEVSKKLLSTGKIRIGLSLCNIAERVMVTSCLRYRGYGHIARDCTETCDYSDECCRVQKGMFLRNLQAGRSHCRY